MQTNVIANDVAIIRESGLFDAAWYCETYPDIALLGLDPIEHYLWVGGRLGRDPSPDFSTAGYLKANPDVAANGMNALLHFAGAGRLESRAGFLPELAPTLIPAAPTFVARRSFEAPKARGARLIAFYLPQFHPIAENDAWWGAGFTEWTNVRPAKQQFLGHTQPHVPHADLGHYDLLAPDTFAKQIDLAKSYGIEAFCFYYYWFAGKRLLEKAIDLYLSDRSLDLPFCLCWANENWSRRWDGLENDVLMAQRHSAEDDLGCIADLARYIRDDRYLHVGGKPLVLIYRPSLFPDIRATAKRWRDWCRANGIGEIHLAYPQSFENADPAEYGFDSAIEFPPNNSGPPDLTDQVVPSDGFTGKVYDWDVLVERSERYQAPPYSLFRSVCPGWDNTARRKHNGTVFVNNSPEKYQRWLSNAVAETARVRANPDERLIFVNAWNEWAEGAHLEPDAANGYAYLEATRSALADEGLVATTERRILLVAHDGYRHGAQYVVLNLARSMRDELGYHVDLIVLGDGPLKDEFACWSTVHDFAGKDLASDEVRQSLAKIRGSGTRGAIANTTVAGALVPALHAAGFTVVSLIHELPKVIRQYQLEAVSSAIARLSDHVVFASPAVAKGFAEFADVPVDRAVIRPQGLYNRNAMVRTDGGRVRARAGLRKRYGIPATAPIILAIGYADWRKAPDLFVLAGLELLKTEPDAYFIWLSADTDEAWKRQFLAPAVDAGRADRFVFAGFVDGLDEHYAGADVYALTSREDPYPSVVLEALDSGLPVVAFADTGGMGDLIAQAGGIVAPAFDTMAYANALSDALRPDVRDRCAQMGPQIIEMRYAFRQYAHDLLRLAGEPLPRVSVIVPNYNYARFIEARLSSIVAQTYPIYELIVLDDASADDSVERMERFLRDEATPHRIHVNTVNSGSVFRQWQRGLEMARGDLVWIAEADDLADPHFLETAVAGFAPGVVMSYTQSRQMDEHGEIFCGDYLDYVADVSRDKWRTGYVNDGRSEVADALFLKNTVPNVSAVVFDRAALFATLTQHGDEIMAYRNAGDWIAYVRLLEKGSIAYHPAALNDHRRHGVSVTLSSFDRSQLDEIMRVHASIHDTHQLGEGHRRRTLAYATELAKQFGLAFDTDESTGKQEVSA